MVDQFMSEPVKTRSGTFPGLVDLAHEHPVTVILRGGSMMPTLRDGQRLAVGAARHYWPGDVMVFRRGDGVLCVHRVLGCRWHRGEMAYVTRGDAAVRGDAPVRRRQVLGRLVEVDGVPWRTGPLSRAAAIAGYIGYARMVAVRRVVRGLSRRS